MPFTHHEFHQFFAWCKGAAEELNTALAALAVYGPDYENQSFPRKDQQNIFWQEDIRDKNVVLAPVLAVMAAEQLISTYAMQRLPDPMVVALGKMDRLDTISKWETLPLMACGKSLSQDSEALKQLRAQIRQRNSFAHPKPMIMRIKDDEQMDRVYKKINGAAAQRIQVALAAPAAVDLLADELLALDGHRKTRLAVETAGVRERRGRDRNRDGRVERSYRYG